MIDKVLKWLGVAWSLLAAVIAAAFFFGGEWQSWEKVKLAVLSTKPGGEVPATSLEVKALDERISKLEARVGGIRLIAVDADPSQPYGCGSTSVAERNSLTVMSGLRDGTSCGVPNVNYYKRIELSIPQE